MSIITPQPAPTTASSPDDRIRAIAARQHGVFATRQALEAGATRDLLRRRTDGGVYSRIAPHILCVAGIPLTDDLLLHAGLLEAGGRSAVAISSASAVWGFPGFARRPFQIVRLRDGTFEETSIATVHTTRRLPDSHLAEVDGMLVTTPTRTLFDLAKFVHRERLENLIDYAWSRRLTSGPLLHRTLPEMAGRGQSGVTVMRELLTVRGPDYIPPESNLEARFMKVMSQEGFGGFRRQVRLGDDIGMIGRVDFLHDARKVIVEIDSDLHHTSISDRRRDTERRDRLEAEGWTVVQVTEFEVWHQPELMLRRVRAALGAV